MLVDINLLPKKEKKSVTPFLVYTFMSLLTLLLIGFGGLMYWSSAEEIKQLESQINQQNKTNLVMQSELEGSTEEKQAKKIQEITQQIRMTIHSISNVMYEVTRLIPAGGTLNAFEMSEIQIDLNITTSSNEDAVKFYQDLQDVKIFDDVTIHTISFVESENNFVTNYTILLQSEAKEEDES
ncbi:hypothetical protein E3U55_15125 [Filobacillus milosensis]|uniref:Tfp pilus assembly protein PilN n=1 Tax=Filobacillus milosensis TaxID=94137 RepID=A0A4Y8IFP1_9BACI|nr:PilN domain-containing protein [Filobacillus milosensis]TFB13894.1 hypothetical protein E3U55_15125 [Filobacillus milosensis]